MAADIEAGKRLRHYRVLRGKSQTDLGEAVGLTFQQIQKYERGANRMGTSRLQQFADVLGVPPTVFFADDNKQADDVPSLVQNGMTVRLLRAFAEIEDTGIQAAITHLVETMGKNGR